MILLFLIWFVLWRLISWISCDVEGVGSRPSTCCDRCVFRNHSPSFPSSCPMFFSLFSPPYEKESKKTFEYNIVYLKKEKEEEEAGTERRRRCCWVKMLSILQLPRDPIYWTVRSWSSTSQSLGSQNQHTPCVYLYFWFFWNKKIKKTLFFSSPRRSSSIENVEYRKKGTRAFLFCVLSDCCCCWCHWCVQSPFSPFLLFIAFSSFQLCWPPSVRPPVRPSARW